MSFHLKAQKAVFYPSPKSSSGIIVTLVDDGGYRATVKLSVGSPNYESAKAILDTLLAQLDYIQEQINAPAVKAPTVPA